MSGFSDWAAKQLLEHNGKIPVSWVRSVVSPEDCTVREIRVTPTKYFPEPMILEFEEPVFVKAGQELKFSISCNSEGSLQLGYLGVCDTRCGDNPDSHQEWRALNE